MYNDRHSDIRGSGGVCFDTRATKANAALRPFNGYDYMYPDPQCQCGCRCLPCAVCLRKAVRASGPPYGATKFDLQTLSDFRGVCDLYGSALCESLEAQLPGANVRAMIVRIVRSSPAPPVGVELHLNKSLRRRFIVDLADHFSLLGRRIYP